MRLIELAKEIGLSPKREGKTLSSPCPACQGTNRFIIWTESDKYWCRRCERSGDAIQFCRDFLGMTYFEACKKLHLPAITLTSAVPLNRKELHIAKEPPPLWKEKAMAFVNWSHHNLINNVDQLKTLRDRMFRDETIVKYRLGFCKNPKRGELPDLYLDRSIWGLLKELKENGKPKKLWCPTGLVIPSFDNSGNVIKLKIRRLAWHEEDIWPKYVEISGSMQQPTWFGYNESLPAIIVESELDAILVQQEAWRLCSTLALGGATKRPDIVTHNLLKKCPQILYALDFDDAGKQQYGFWRQNYLNLRAWPTPIKKSPGDAFKNGVSIHQWVVDGILYYKQ